MGYVEFLRVRKTLLWFAGIFAALILISEIFHAFERHPQVTVVGAGSMNFGAVVPLSALVPVAAFVAAIFASIVGTSLSRENATRDLSWTKPIPRTVLAVQFVLIDVAAIVVAFALFWVPILYSLVRARARFFADPGFDAQQLFLGIGVAVMWYALIQLLTAYFPPGARAMAGIAWPVALISMSVTNAGGAFGAIMRAIDTVNPFAYLNGSGMENGTAFAQTSVDVRAAVVWCFAVLFSAIAVALWTRKEA